MEGGNLGWLGYFIGRNETLDSLYVHHLPTCKDQVERFFTGMQSNKSIKKMVFGGDGNLSETFAAINLPHVTTLSMEFDLDHENVHFSAFGLGLRRCLSLESYHGPVTKEIAASLVALPKLEKIHAYTIEDNAISQGECAALRTLLANATNMKQLHVHRAGLGNDGVALLAEGLACNSSLTGGVLGLSNNDIGDDGLQALTSSLVRNTKLRELDLGYNNIGDAGLEALADSLAHNRALHALSIAGNTAITEAGVKAISRVLQSRNSSLRDLNLDLVNINDEGGKILAHVLTINKSLVKLSLRCWNDVSIDDDGLRALSSGLSRNNTLQSLDLSSNTAITVAGLRSLKQYFSSPSCALENLALHGINIGDEGSHALADALGRNKSVKRLRFHEIGITFIGWEAFLKLLCDTSSPNSIYLSNHTLRDLSPCWYIRTRSDVQNSILRWLKINETSATPNLAAKAKILNSSPGIDMVPWFQWDLKLLPLVKGWFAVSSSNDELAARIQREKLSAVYQFVRGLPMLVVYDFRRYLADQVQRIRARCEYHYNKISELEEEEHRLMKV